MPSVTSRLVDATAPRVWNVLSDGWLFGLWVVGASRIRKVDSSWPAEGARIEHSVGCWPALIDDSTFVTSMTAERQLGLQARAWPGGEASVRLQLEPEGESCRVTITEDVVRGPGTLVPEVLRHPVLDWRNRESLRRLSYLAEHRNKTAAQ